MCLTAGNQAFQIIFCGRTHRGLAQARLRISERDSERETGRLYVMFSRQSKAGPHTYGLYHASPPH